MPSSLPTDLYAEVLQYLSGEHLKSCSLVCSEFLRLARPRLTWHFNQDDTGKRRDLWKAFTLQDEKKELYFNAKSLTLREGEIDPDLPQYFPNLRRLSLLYTWGPLESFGFMSSFSQVHSLSLAGIDDILLSNLLDIFPSLKRLELEDVEFGDSVQPTSYESAPELDYLAINNLSVLRGEKPLAKYLEYKSGAVHSLRLNCTWEYNRPIATYFVSSLKPFLQHIYIGPKFYRFITIMINPPSDARFCIPFAELPQLQTLEFETALPSFDETWTRWLSWLALQLQHEAPASRRNIQFISLIQESHVKQSGASSKVSCHNYAVNAFAESSRITLVFLLQTRWTRDVGIDAKCTMVYGNGVQFLKDCFEAWHSSGKLDIRREWL
ncbi:hypothetical protein DL96DRAFT_1710986 [Flagelloscypha sp. PMI_526]|nr:hypothetical protein DL96DRAFT_1710986 [Flagelloscypha sp. PMI_526]